MLKSLILLMFGACALTAQAQTASPTPTPEAGVVASAASAAASAASLPEGRRKIRVVRFAQAPVVDGRLDEPVWKEAAVLEGFLQTQPGDNIAPSRKTEVLLGFDQKYIYLGFRAFETAGKVRATIPKRDNVTEDDNVRILLDTFDDQRRAYIFMFNPLGVQQDGILTEGMGEDFTLDFVHDSRGVVTEDGYTVEARIPFKSLRYEIGGDRVWGVHAFRRIKHLNNELNSWMPISRSTSGLLNQAGQLTGIEDVAGGRALEIIPSLTLSEAGRRVNALPAGPPTGGPGVNDPGRFVNEPIGLDPGVTVKLGITPTTTLDLTVNPDFAQVEADELVVTANQRFPIFFEEKRPFFLEGIDIFSTNLFAVNTRAIVDPNAAVKLTGKRGRNSYGILLAADNAPGNFSSDERLDPANARFLDKDAHIGVVRLKRDLGADSSVGLVATTYNFIERHNHVGGFDGRFRLDQKTFFSFQALGSNSRRRFYDPDLDESPYRTGNGFAYYFSLNRSGRNFTLVFDGLGRTRDYRSDVGFLRRTDTNTNDLFIRYASDPDPKARLISWSVFNSSRPSYDWRGRMQRWANESQLALSFPRQGSLNVGFVAGHERVFEEEFGPRRGAARAGAFAGPDPERSSPSKAVYVSGGVTPSKKYSLFGSFTYTRGELDFDFGAGPRFPRVSPAALADPDAPLDPGPGDSTFLYTSVAYQPTDTFRATLDYTKARLARHDTGRVAFDTNIFALRATQQFTRFTFARARLDYDTLASTVRGQVLLGWAPNPGTALYAGYNDDLSYNGFSPFTGQLEQGFRRNGRTFFIKLSYLFRRDL